MWVRGLKRLRLYTDQMATSVAPRVGAWIENTASTAISLVISVAPRVGAWIENLEINGEPYKCIRRTPCGCVD